MSLADRLAVMNDGELHQVGTPKEVYENPVNEFVAGFLGEPSMNFLDSDRLDTVDAADRLSETSTVGVRPEDVVVTKENGVAANSGSAYEVVGEALVVEPLGNAYEIEFDCSGESVTARLRNRPEAIEPGATATLQFPVDAVHRFAADGEVIEG